MADFKTAVKNSIGLVGLVLGCSQEATLENVRPHFLRSTRSIGVAYFGDNAAEGMKAFAASPKGDVELQTYVNQRDFAGFYIPGHLMDRDALVVWAVDRDGNKSDLKGLYPFRGALLEHAPPPE